MWPSPYVSILEIASSPSAPRNDDEKLLFATCHLPFAISHTLSAICPARGGQVSAN